MCFGRKADGKKKLAEYDGYKEIYFYLVYEFARGKPAIKVSISCFLVKQISITPECTGYPAISESQALETSLIPVGFYSIHILIISYLKNTAQLLLNYYIRHFNPAVMSLLKSRSRQFCHLK